MTYENSVKTMHSEVREVLRTINKNPLRFFLDSGIKGVPRNSMKCLLSRYMNEKFPDYVFQTAPSNVIWSRRGDCLCEGGEFLEDSTVEFLGRFDFRHYPELEATST